MSDDARYHTAKAYRDQLQREQARVRELEDERDILREALRRMVDIVADPFGTDPTADELEAIHAAASLVGHTSRLDSAERGLASIRAAVEAKRSGT